MEEEKEDKKEKEEEGCSQPRKERALFLPKNNVPTQRWLSCECLHYHCDYASGIHTPGTLWVDNLACRGYLIK